MQNTTTLDTRIDDLTFTVDQIANGSRGLLEEVATGKVTGEEEYWSRTDLWDFQANVDGARVGFEGVEPLVERKDPELAAELQERFDDAAGAARRAGDGRRLHVLRRPQPGRDQEARGRGQRAVRAAVPADGRGGRLTMSRTPRSPGAA